MFGIDKDHGRFRQIVKGNVRKDLRKHMSSEEILARKGGNVISVPLPKIQLPRFKYASDGQGGVGQGPGDGDPGDDEHKNILEVDVSLEEMADLLGEELQLPRIEPKGKKDLTIDSNKYKGLRRVGPESLRSFKHTFKEALKRAMIAGDYDPDNPNIIPIKDDRRYRSPEPVYLPLSQAVIIYMMDVSGSMGEEHKMLARLTSFWIDTWIRKNFKFIVSRYLIHNTEAWEVNESDFYRIREGGGTKIQSAYRLARDIIHKEYSPHEWNIYIFHYSDGDDWGSDSTNYACQTIKDMLPHTNQIAYLQVKRDGRHGGSFDGGFYKAVNSKFKHYPNFVCKAISHREEVYDAIKTFFQAGQ